MSDEFVRRQSVFNVITDVANSRPYRIPGKPETYSEYNEGWTDCADSIERNMSLLHSVQPERKKGTWLPIIETNEFGEPYQAGVHCSRCGHATVYETSFCPDCGVIMDGNPIVDIYIGSCSEIPNNSDGEYDPKPDIYYLAEKIGIHRLYALVVQLRGEPESCIDTISRRAAVEAIANQSRFSAKEIINICDKSVQDENGWLGGLKEAILAVLELPSAQPETAKRIVGKSKDGMTLWYQCDMCNEPVDAQDNFCRGCGRRLTDG